MQDLTWEESLRRTALTLAVGGAGAWLGWLLSIPVFLLSGPAVSVTIGALAGLPVMISPRLREMCFLVLGLMVGTGFDAEAYAVMGRWPLAIVAMAGALWCMLHVSCFVLQRWFGFERQAAVLAASPGHLSLTIAMAVDLKMDVVRISVTQSVRLFSLTIAVPFVALALGIDVPTDIVPRGEPMLYFHLIGLAGLGWLLGRIFRRFGVPAPLLMGAMLGSGVTQVTGLTPGVLPPWILMPIFLVFGSLIGTRFAGVSLPQFGQGLVVGVVVTVVAVVIAALAAIPVAWWLGMPIAHVLVAFSPGGLETMIAMGSVLGTAPGFVAACHIARLFLLLLLLPAFLTRKKRDQFS